MAFPEKAQNSGKIWTCSSSGSSKVVDCAWLYTVARRGCLQ